MFGYICTLDLYLFWFTDLDQSLAYHWLEQSQLERTEQERILRSSVVM